MSVLLAQTYYHIFTPNFTPNYPYALPGNSGIKGIYLGPQIIGQIIGTETM
jgi:hypothetical protein